MEIMENKTEIIKKNMEMVCSINRVEGFNPEAEAKQMLQSEKGADGKIKTFLPLQKKKQWFRLKNSQGKITYTEEYPNLPKDMPFKEKQEILNKIDKVIVIARIYENKTDAEDAFIGEGYGVVYADDTGISFLNDERKYPEMIKMARGNAESRAFFNAGFGLQFYGDEVELIDEIANNPEKIPSAPSAMVSVNTEEMQIKSENGYSPIEPQTDIDVEKSEASTTALTSSVQKTGRRTYQQIYDDAYVSLSEMKTEIRNIHKIKKAAETEIEKISLENKLDKLKNKWEKETELMQKAVSKGVKEKEGIELNFDCILESEIPSESSEAQSETEKAEIHNDCLEETGMVHEEPSGMVQEEPSPIKADSLKEKDVREVVCTFGTYKGRTYGEIYESQKNILVWLHGKDIPEEEKTAVITLCMQDDELKAKLERV